jgi:hypothetical protein
LVLAIWFLMVVRKKSEIKYLVKGVPTSFFGFLISYFEFIWFLPFGS